MSRREAETAASYDDVAPDASAMIESLRAHGYTLQTAIADIIDNSIAASCKNVWLTMDWSSGSPYIAITDDGSGMDESELISAMRLGSKSPLEYRAPSDLGRFGLGLKTASFSQSRRLTVVSKKNGVTSLRRWDLDHLSSPMVSGWQLLKSAHARTGSRSEEIVSRRLSSGTLVILEVLDRVTRSDRGQNTEIAENHWVSEVSRVRQHLAMVFHRFLADKSKLGVQIFLNETPVIPWDPFCCDEHATQRFPEDSDSSLGSEVSVKGFVLPHRDRFDPDDPTRSRRLHQDAAGPLGWNAQQGFYLYRNRRLIIPGDWLGLGPGQNGWKKEEHFKLARIQIDIPNSMDQEWQIDVKKSSAIAPPALRTWLTGLAKVVRDRAKEVYAYRGGHAKRKSNTRQVNQRPWITRKLGNGTFSYQIDRKHVLFDALLSTFSREQKTSLETLLRLIEETVPVQRIWIDTADNQDGVAQPFEGEKYKKLRDHITTCHNALVNCGSSEQESWEQISDFPAFQTLDAKAIIGEILEQRGIHG